jgi:hypothetical protein
VGLHSYIQADGKRRKERDFFFTYKPGIKNCRILDEEINKDLLNSFSKNKDSYSWSMLERNNKKCIQKFCRETRGIDHLEHQRLYTSKMFKRVI